MTMMTNADDAPKDVLDTTSGSRMYEGTTTYSAEGNPYGSQSWLLRADDETSAIGTLASLSDDSIYADPRIDHLREHEVEEIEIEDMDAIQD